MTQDELAKLSVAERLSLIGELWDSIGDDAPLPKEQQEELVRRLASFEEDKADARSWETIKAQLDR